MATRRGRLGALVPVALAPLLAMACGGDPTGPESCSSEAAAIILDPARPPDFVRLREGAVVRLSFENACGEPIVGGPVSWTSSDSSVATAVRIDNPPSGEEGFIRSVGFGSALVTAAYQGVSAELTVRVTRPETDASAFTVLGFDTVGAATTDLWVHEDWAYSGSAPWDACGGSDPCPPLRGRLYVWRLDGDAGVSLGDSVALPGPWVNDVKVSSDGSFAVVTQEGDNAANGIVVLDLAIPSRPQIVAHFTDGLEGGVHNVWIETLEGRDIVFVVEDGGASGGLHILDVTERSTPVRIGHFYGGSSLVHDVYVRDGLAFVSHWNAGLVILDVGNGVAGGTLDEPREVSRVVTAGGHVHNAWYWPERGLVFVGEERANPEDPLDVGVMHVVDASDLSNPRETATFGSSGTTPHNFWLDETRGILFAAWYDKGLRAIDVNGELAGDLGQQGRELGHVLPSGPRGAASIWAPQLHDGRVYVSDIVHGIWAVRFEG